VANWLKARLTALSIMLPVVVTALLAVAFSYTSSTSTSYGSPEGTDRANVEFRAAILAVREAETAGADEGQLRILTEQLNSVLWMIERAERLALQGDLEGAAVQADRSVEVSKGVVLEASRVRDGASLRTYYGKVLTFGMVPVASLLVTAITHFGWKWRRRHELDRLMRMEIKGVKEPEEET